MSKEPMFTVYAGVVRMDNGQRRWIARAYDDKTNEHIHSAEGIESAEAALKILGRHLDDARRSAA